MEGPNKTRRPMQVKAGKVHPSSQPASQPAMHLHARSASFRLTNHVHYLFLRFTCTIL